MLLELDELCSLPGGGRLLDLAAFYTLESAAFYTFESGSLPSSALYTSETGFIASAAFNSANHYAKMNRRWRILADVF